MDRNLNVLLYPSGSENALEVKEALSYVVNINVFGASSKSDHSEFVYHNYIKAPSVQDDDFINRFNHLIEENNIHLIVPCHDTVALYLSQHHQLINAKILNSPYETSNICRHKILIYQTFKRELFCPKLYQYPLQVKDIPVYIKPDIGEGGKCSYKIENLNELHFYLNNYIDKKFVITEYLPGDEYTVDCFTDTKRILRYVGPRTRSRVWGGISMRSKTVADKAFNKIAEIINTKMEFRGYWYFQVKRDKEENLKLLEISTRPAGTMSLYRQRGINFMLLSIYDALGYEIVILDNHFEIELDRSLISHYRSNLIYNTIYLDFDDTLICKGKVNRWCLFLLYQAHEKNISVILLTKHELDIRKALNKYGLSDALFKRIVTVKEDQNKDEFITTNNSIFIDNSFVERNNVYKKKRIPVFDADSVACLLDWKN
jgi:hypothetical protein